VSAAVFAAAAVAGLAGAGAVLLAPRAATARAGLRLCLLAGLCAYVQVLAPAVAAAQLVLLAAAAVTVLELPDPAPSAERRWPRVVAGLAVGGLGLVLVSTWARQYVWAGRELAPGSRFGAAAALGQAWVEGYAPVLVAGLLVLVVAALAGPADGR
jgi:NADH:ubiquinone oxidoreductase subunit 6 (subunit J)